MVRKRYFVFFLGIFLLFFLNTASKNETANQSVSEDTTVYGIYVKGIRFAEMTIEEKHDSRIYSIIKREKKSKKWSSAILAAEHELENNKDFRLGGAILNLPSQLRELNKIDWKSLKAVGWPDENSIYIRHRELTEFVGDKKITAYYWALKDATVPMDLIIGPKNELIAGIDVRNDFCMVLHGYENFTSIKHWNNTKISPAKYGYRSLGKHMVRMSDGIKLATLVYLPDDGTDGPYPVIFIRTPYGIGNLIDWYWHYCARGYALVFQACRGTIYWDPANKSEGSWEICINEPKDGKDALAWLSRQTWCNGNIGMLGGSYVGYTQWACTMADNPALKCIIPEVSMGTVFSDQPYWGGGFVEGLAYYSFFMLNTKILPERNWSDILRYRPLIDLDEYATGKDIPQWNTMLEHWILDSYWREQDWNRDVYRRNVSAFQISGWFDDDFPGTRRNWEVMKKTKNKPQRLLIGPWKHGYNTGRRLNGFSMGLDSLRDDIWILKQKWFDRFLKGIKNGVEEPVVEYYVLGDNKWRTASQWPPEEITHQKWYFHSNGKAHILGAYGKLNASQPANAEPSDVYRYNPEDPPPNWMSFEQMTRWQDVQTFPYDFRDIESRHDIAVYTSEPLEKDLTIAGDILVLLYASCDVRDTDWWIHLSDVYPDGSSVRLTMGMLRARFRNLEDKLHHISGSNFEKEELLTGNLSDVVRYEIGLRSIAATFQKGHRLRIAVMNACDNYSFPNSNTGENEAFVKKTVVGTMAIHHSPKHPSNVILPALLEEGDEWHLISAVH